MIVAFIRLVRRFYRNRRANVAIIAALCAVPMFGLLGFAMDYGIALADKSKLDNAADEAAVVAIKTVQTVMQAGGSFSSAQSQAITQAQMAFKASAGRLAFASIPTVTPNITQVNQTISSTVSYSTPMATNFSKMLGIPSINVAGTVAASLSLTTYIRVYILVDVSQSMGIGTDAANMQALYNRVVQYNNGSGGETGCVFGCHVTTGSQVVTNEYLAHNISPPITLRIDSAISAVQAVISQAQTAAGSNNNIQIGLYAISLNPTTASSYINTVASPSTNYSNLTSLASTLSLGANNSGGTGDSTFSTSLTDFYSTVLGPQGTGASPTSPLNYVFLVTDGVQDVYGASCTSGHCVQALNPSLCTNIKQSATLGVIYTTYNAIYNANNAANGYETNYAALVQPIAANISPNLQACATPSTQSTTYFYEAADGATLIADMQKLFASTMLVARLTQ
jgi:Flp pilus assembly protein TadG